MQCVRLAAALLCPLLLALLVPCLTPYSSPHSHIQCTQSLEESELPLSFAPGAWALSTSYPHALLRDRGALLSEVADGARSLALFVSQL